MDRRAGRARWYGLRRVQPDGRRTHQAELYRRPAGERIHHPAEEDAELIEPGVVPASEWRPAPGETVPERSDINVWTAVGRKP